MMHSARLALLGSILVAVPGCRTPADRNPEPDPGPAVAEGLHGTLLDDLGQPRPDTELELYRGELASHPRFEHFDWWAFDRLDAEAALLGRTTSDASGRWAFGDAGAGSYLLRARHGQIHVLREAMLVGEGVTDGVELALTRGLWIEGHALVPDGRAPEGPYVTGANDLIVDARANRPEQWIPGYVKGWGDVDRALMSELDEDGAFRLGPLGPGSATVALVTHGSEDGATEPVTLDLVQLDLPEDAAGGSVFRVELGPDPAGARR